MSENVNFDVSQEECTELVRLHPEQAAGEIIALRALLTCAEDDIKKLKKIKYMAMGLVQQLMNDGYDSDAVVDLYVLATD